MLITNGRSFWCLSETNYRSLDYLDDGFRFPRVPVNLRFTFRNDSFNDVEGIFRSSIFLLLEKRKLNYCKCHTLFFFGHREGSCLHSSLRVCFIWLGHDGVPTIGPDHWWIHQSHLVYVLIVNFGVTVFDDRFFLPVTPLELVYFARL